MSTIPTKLTEERFEQCVSLHLSKTKRGFVSKISLYKIFNYILYFLYTGCQWDKLPIDKSPTSTDSEGIASWDVPWAIREIFRGVWDARWVYRSAP